MSLNLTFLSARFGELFSEFKKIVGTPTMNGFIRIVEGYFKKWSFFSGILKQFAHNPQKKTSKIYEVSGYIT